MSAKTKWIAGPWRRVHSTIYRENFASVSEGLTPIASIRLRPRARNLSEAETATGDLIAAAPVLAAFVERFTNLLGTPKARLMDDLMVQARAALALARGETP